MSEVVLEATGSGSVMLPDGFSVADASFERNGEDLILTEPDGSRVVISDYFSAEPQLSLTTPDGAQISGAMVGKLAGPSTSGQDITAGTDAGTEAIGAVNTISGKVFVIRVDGTRVELEIDTPLYSGDILETGSDGAVGVVLADETTLAMGGDGRLILDEMIYDPGTQEGSLSLVALKGIYTIVSGMVSKTDPDAMVIETPVGSIGIRGTQIGIDISDGQNLTVVMMIEADGYVGEVYIRNEGGVQVMNEANHVLFTSAHTLAPEFKAPVSDADIVRMFESTLLHLPQTTGQANDYSTQEAEGGGELDGYVTDAGETIEEEVSPPEDVNRVSEQGYASPPLTEPAPVPATEPPPEQLEPLGEEQNAPPVEEERVETTPITTEPFASAGIVVAPNTEPTAGDLPVTTSEDQPVSGQLMAEDVDQDALSYSLADDGAPGNGSVNIHADGSYTYTPSADFSGTDSFTYAVSDGEGGVTTAMVSINVGTVPDVPVLTVSAASGAEDTDIALTISADVPGAEEISQITISGVPEGATLNAGKDNGDGSWTLSGDDLQKLGSLTLKPPADSSKDMSLSVTAMSTDGGIASASIGVAVAAIADTPELQVSDVVFGEIGDGGEGGEGGKGGKGGKGGEGGEFKGSHGDDVIYGTDGNDVISGKDGADILYGYGGEDLEGGFTVVPLTITAALNDQDSSESLGVAITGIPDGATLNAGTEVGGGLWTLAPDELEGLELTLPEDYQGDFQLAVTATSTDVDVDTGVTEQAAASAIINVAYEGSEGGVGDNDLLKGGRGDDVLYGGGGDDVLKGDGGDDVLVGGAGDDILKGGRGKDVFVFDSQAGRDIIEDFHEGEVLRFEGKEFSPENLSVSQNGKNVSLMFEGQDVEVTLNHVDLNKQSYSVTQDGDAVLVTFENEN